MDEDKMLKFLKDVGLNKPVNEEDFQLYHDYFDVRSVSGDESSEDDKETEQDVDQDILTDSVFDQVPTLNVADFGNTDIAIVEENVVIEIETTQNDPEIVEENDEGLEIVTVEEVNDNLGSYVSENDRHLIVDFLAKGCSCKAKCATKFSLNNYLEMRLEAAEIDHYRDHVNILDQVILGQLRCLRNDSDQTERSHKQNFVRKQPQTTYLIKGQQVCRDTYMFCHQIKIKRLKRILKMYNDSGLVAKVHGNAKKIAKNATSFTDAKYVVNFINNYAEQHAIYLPGRSSTVYNTNLKLLPSSDSKKKIYDIYNQSFTGDMVEKPVSLRVFKNIWRETCSTIVVMRPKSDLCSLCQKHYTSGAAMVLASEEEKIANVEKMKAHLELVKSEREFYKNSIDMTKQSLHNPQEKSVHYSFDMAQQVHIPSNPLQPGPIYFLVPFKIGIFGVMCETTNKQVNYLIPESVSSTKGSNLITSLFHHYLEQNSKGEDVMYIHADNCVGQNKNNILLGYLAWRISNNKNKMIVLSFMPVGHTKFSCDWAFGLFKKKFRTMYISSIQELIDCAFQSTPNCEINSAVSVGNEKGEVKIQVFDWLNFFKDFKSKKIPLITQYNHFEFNENNKGKVLCKTNIQGNKFVFTIFPTDEGPSGFPKEIIPPGNLT